MMNVGELIERLSKFDKGATVLFKNIELEL